MVIGILALVDHGDRQDTFVNYQIQTMHKAIVRFALDTGRCPTQEEGLSVLVAGNYLDHSPIDGWGNEYVYQTDGHTYSLKSYGADGHPGGDGFNADIERTFVCAAPSPTPT